MKILIVSNSKTYANEIEHSGNLLGVETVAKYVSASDFEKGVDSLSYDFVITSDVLYQDAKLEEVIEIAKAHNVASKLVVVLKNTGKYEGYLSGSRIKYHYESDTPPMTLINSLLSSSMAAQPVQTQSQATAPQQPWPQQAGQEQTPYMQQPQPLNPQGYPQAQSPFMQQPLQPNPYMQQPAPNTYYQQQSQRPGQSGQYIPNQPSFPTQPMAQMPQQPGPQVPPQNGGYQQAPSGSITQNMPNPWQQNTVSTPSQPVQPIQPMSQAIPPMGNSFMGKSSMIVINSQKGGVGKSSTAIELAYAIGYKSKGMDLNPTSKLSHSKMLRIALVDLNPANDTIASTLSVTRNKTQYPTVLNWAQAIELKIYQELTDEEKEQITTNPNLNVSQYCSDFDIHFTKEEVDSLMVYDEEANVYVLPAVSLSVDVQYIPREYIKVILKTIKEHFDISIVDTANNLSYFTIEAFYAADEVFLVTAPSISTTSVVKRALDSCKSLGVDTSKFNLVINYPNRATSDISEEIIEEGLGVKLVSVLPYEPQLGASHEAGKTFSTRNTKSKYAQSIIRLAQQIIPLWQVKRQGSSGHRLFGRK